MCAGDRTDDGNSASIKSTFIAQKAVLKGVFKITNIERKVMVIAFKEGASGIILFH